MKFGKMKKTKIKSVESRLNRLRHTEREIIEQIISFRKAELKEQVDKIKIDKS